MATRKQAKSKINAKSKTAKKLVKAKAPAKKIVKTKAPAKKAVKAKAPAKKVVKIKAPAKPSPQPAPEVKGEQTQQMSFAQIVGDIEECMALDRLSE